MPPLSVDSSHLAPLPRAFLAALQARLDVLAPPLLDATMTKATPRDDGVEVVLAHAEVIAFSVWAQAARTEIVVGCAALHSEHRDAASALAVVEQLLTGAREVPSYDGTALRPTFLA